MKTPAGLLGRFAKYNSDLDSEEWRKFTARVRQAQGNYCQICKQANKPNNVHHIFYDHTRKLWEYETDEVLVLCEPCHKQMHHELNHFRKLVFKNLNPSSFRTLNGALAFAFDYYEPLTFAHALAEFVSSPGLVQRYADHWEASAVKKEGQ